MTGEGSGSQSTRPEADERSVDAAASNTSYTITNNSQDNNSSHEQESNVTDTPLGNEDADEDDGEDDPGDDNDSAFGGEDYIGSETATLSSDILRFRQERGRSYHSYGMEPSEWRGMVQTDEA